jgi:hypothetical protein
MSKNMSTHFQKKIRTNQWRKLEGNQPPALYVRVGRAKICSEQSRAATSRSKTSKRREYHRYAADITHRTPITET